MKLKIFFATVATLLFIACTNANKVVEFPLVGTSNTTIPVIEKVELTDTATVLNVRGVFIPNYWIKISSNGHLEAQGKKYKLIGSEGIKPDKELFMPADGDSCFTLFYEPLPKDCKQFDLIEGTGDGDWRIYDIDLTGKRNASAPADLPKKLERKYNTEQEPQYAYTFGETTVNIHLLGYREGCTDNIELSINSTFEKQHNIDGKIDPATGKGTAKFVQYGTVSLYPCILSVKISNICCLTPSSSSSSGYSNSSPSVSRHTRLNFSVCDSISCAAASQHIPTPISVRSE